MVFIVNPRISLAWNSFLQGETWRLTGRVGSVRALSQAEMFFNLGTYGFAFQCLNMSVLAFPFMASLHVLPFNHCRLSNSYQSLRCNFYCILQLVLRWQVSVRSWLIPCIGSSFWCICAPQKKKT